MKTCSTKYRFRAAAAFLCALFALTALPGCSSDSEPTPVAPAPAPGDDMAVINLAFSAPSIESEAQNPFAREAVAADNEDNIGYDVVDTDVDETNINDLWVYFFQKDGDSYKLWKAFDVVNDAAGTSDYSSMSLPNTIKTTDQPVISGIIIPKGDYKIYVLANIKGYMPKDDNGDVIEDTDISPSTVNNLNSAGKAALEDRLLSYEFTTKNTDHDKYDHEGIICGDLPMGAYYTEVALSNNSGSISAADGIISIGDGASSGTLSAQLTYLCAKVRYTFLFDSSVSEDGKTYGFSYPIQSFDLEVLGVHNALQNAALFPDNFNGTFSSHFAEQEIFEGDDEKGVSVDAGVQINGCVLSEFPDDEKIVDSKNNKTLLGVYLDPNSTVIPKKLDAYSGETPRKQFSYQGMVYLPENKAGSTNAVKNGGAITDGDKTYLHLRAKLDGEDKDYIINLPAEKTNEYLKHGTYYDIVGKITSRGAEFNVKVKKWVKSSNKTSKPI